MTTHAPTFPENRFAENRSPDPNDSKNRGKQESETDHEHEQHDSDVLKKPRRFSRKDVEQNIAPEPDPDDPVAP
jgi:hypothetical protein